MERFVFIILVVPLAAVYLGVAVLSPIFWIEERTNRRVWPGLLWLWLSLVVPLAAVVSFL